MTVLSQGACLSIRMQDLPGLQDALSVSIMFSQIEGKENLPPKDQPAVYVANHQSFLVRRSVLHLHRLAPPHHDLFVHLFRRTVNDIASLRAALKLC